jgi:DNA-binding CsgD family transcriptional regulator
MSISEVADYMNITDRAVRVLKTRVAQKLGITSIELIDYLQKLTNAD